MSRRRSRLEAVEVLYAADVRGTDVADVLEERSRERQPDAYALTLVEGVRTQRGEIDALLGAKSIGWPVARMSPVDRNVLRVGVFELLGGDVPVAVAIDEAVEVARHFSGEEAARFVNGVLAAVLADHQGSDAGRS